MTYIVARMYSGTGQRNLEELVQLVDKELVPKLAQAGRLRYNTLATTDGRIGSASMYESKEAADKAVGIAAEFMGSTGAMQGYTLAQTIGGERIFDLLAHDHTKPPPNASGSIRVYQTSASAEDVTSALKEEATPIAYGVGGFVRYQVVKLDDGTGYAAFTVCTTQEGGQEFTQKAREIRAKENSKLSKVFPQAPEVIEVTIMSFSES